MRASTPARTAPPLLARGAACLAVLLAALALLTGCTTAETARDTQAPPPSSAATQDVASAEAAPTSPAEEPELPAEKPEPEPSEAEPTALEIRLQAATVTRVVDGDTAHLRLAKSGAIEKVRFIGVDTPESTIEHEPYGAEASAYTKKRLTVGRKIYLEIDAEKRDRYGRLLAYLWLSKPTEAETDGRPTLGETTKRMFNAQLMRDGYAQVLTVPPNVRYQDYFLTLQRKARNADRGLWGLPAATGSSSGNDGSGSPDVSGATYIGNRNTMKFHRAECSSVNQMNPANKVPLETRKQAIAAGYVPCKNCQP